MTHRGAVRLLAAAVQLVGQRHLGRVISQLVVGLVRLGHLLDQRVRLIIGDGPVKTAVN